MSRGKYVFLLGLVIAAAGGSIWIVVLALRAEALDGTVLRAVVPLTLLAGVALRALRKGGAR